MKIIAVLFIILALVIGIVPQFTDCASQGRTLTLDTGKTVPMKCHWTARGEIAVAIPLFVVGVVLLFVRSKEAQRWLSIVGAVLGLTAILLPLYLIGVCSVQEMWCNMIMQPTILAAGILTIVIGIVGVFLARNGKSQTPAA
jgi:hypothetical protein